ncbi:hypothetical protein R2083_12290 [Nitrosomonas sp. Is35]|uniref:hypothetical protein n=1 Tax=Nitrosomonas sp. Is35 TaxID=3080534 RepID=UPI00294B6178|nr:hypothetical protein [Nitrosomonas sp. Is35]MDV6348295.1 hypothetical protein [Nitrosomonas sp. Is35]
MTGFDMFATHYKTMIHRSMQTGFVAAATRIYARLHVDIVHIIFSSKVKGAKRLALIAVRLKEKAADMNCNYAKDTRREKKRLYGITQSDHSKLC